MGTGRAKEIYENGGRDLAPQQIATLNEFIRQTQAFPRLGDPNSKVVEKLGMTAEQQEQLSALRKETSNWFRQDHADQTDKILAVLTPQQRAQLREEAFGPDWPDSCVRVVIEIGGAIGTLYVPGTGPVSRLHQGGRAARSWALMPPAAEQGAGDPGRGLGSRRKARRSSGKSCPRRSGRRWRSLS